CTLPEVGMPPQAASAARSPAARMAAPKRRPRSVIGASQRILELLHRLGRRQVERRHPDRAVPVARKREPEARPVPRLRPDVEVALVESGVLEGDREAEAGPADGALPGGVGPPEPIEDAREVV